MGENKVKNKFQQSLINNELSNLICGEGEYFIFDREAGGHWPMGSYKSYVEPNLLNGILPVEFWEQLYLCFDRVDDLNIFLDNLVAYFIPYYNCLDSDLKKLRVTNTPAVIIHKIKEILQLNKENLLTDLRGTGSEWNTKTGLWGGITSNLLIIRKRGGPNFLSDEFV